MYTALVCRIETSPIDGADNIQKGTCSGYNVIVSKEVKNNQLGIFFPSDGQLTHQMCFENKLYRKHPKTGEKLGGYLEKNRRVRNIKLLGITSEGIWLPLDSLKWVGLGRKFKKTYDTDINITRVVEGAQFTHFNGVRICRKYVTPATRSKSERKLPLKQRVSNWIRNKFGNQDRRSFPMHFETAKLRHAIGGMTLSEKAYLYITIKMHGTSARSGRVRDTSIKSRVKGYFGLKPKYKDILGTRRCILPHPSVNDEYRFTAHNMIKGHLRDGEIIYYEIVGYGENGPIMDRHKVTDKILRKKYGDTMTYSYGMYPVEEGKSAVYGVNFDIYVYRITHFGIELSPSEIYRRCQALGLKTVPLIKKFHWGTSNKRDFLDQCSKLSNVENKIDQSHIHEGICVRIIDGMKDVTYKYKNATFCLLEGIKKNEDNYEDPEEI